jgi:thiamine-monophosphate kinase
MNDAVRALHEFALVDRLCEGLPRSPDQVNARHESDAELVRLPGGQLLAVTIDTLAEEYRLGLLRDPELVGWANVVHSLTDLAATGARPIGMMLAYTLPEDCDDDWRKALTAGATAALEAHGTFCLGGDTSFGDPASFQSVGLGLVDEGHQLTRSGARPGDKVYLTGPAGIGNLLGLTRTMDQAVWEKVQPLYRPRARFDVVADTRPSLRAAVDTSDGLLSALDLLGRVGGVGMRVLDRPELYRPELVDLSERLGTPLWIGGAFGMGDYELALVVDAAQESAFVQACSRLGTVPVLAAEVREEPGLRLVRGDAEYELDATRLMNLFAESPGPEEYVRALLAFDAEMRA